MKILYIIGFLFFSAGAANAQAKEDNATQAERVEYFKSVEIFPNPTPDYVHVRFTNIPVKNVKLTVHNIIGNQMNVELEVIDNFEIRVRVKELDSGYYLIALKDDEDKNRATYKFLKR